MELTSQPFPGVLIRSLPLRKIHTTSSKYSVLYSQKSLLNISISLLNAGFLLQTQWSIILQLESEESSQENTGRLASQLLIKTILKPDIFPLLIPYKKRLIQHCIIAYILSLWAESLLSIIYNRRIYIIWIKRASLLASLKN